MSLIHADNFNIYGNTTADMTAAGRYSSVGAAAIVADPDGVSTGRVIRFNDNGGMRRALKTPDPVLGVGFRIWLSSLPSDDSMRPGFTWSDATNTSMFRILINTTGSISAYVFDTTSGAFGDWFLIATTPGPVMTAGAWWQIESKFDGDALTFELRVEGVPKIDLDSTDFAGHLHNGPNVYQASVTSAANFIGASIDTHLKDYFWWDSLGTQNVDFLGACLVAQLNTSADVDLGYWVPSTGTTGWDILDNDPADTPYLSGATPVGDAMEFEQTDLPPDISSVKGIITVVRAKKEDGGDGQMQVSLVSQGDDSDGEDRPITASYTDWEDVHELDPHTSAPWVPAAVDLSDIKISRTI